MTPHEIDEIKRHFSVVAEGLRSDIRQVADGVEGIRFEFSALKDEVKQEFEETRAMIRLSYAELDRRLRSLESRQDAIEIRMERLETR